jgi:hypothetical protein
VSTPVEAYQIVVPAGPVWELLTACLRMHGTEVYPADVPGSEPGDLPVYRTRPMVLEGEL